MTGDDVRVYYVCLYIHVNYIMYILYYYMLKAYMTYTYALYCKMRTENVLGI